MPLSLQPLNEDVRDLLSASGQPYPVAIRENAAGLQQQRALTQLLGWGRVLWDGGPPMSLLKVNDLPVGQKRHLDVAGQKLPRDNFVSQLSRSYPHRGVMLKEKRMPSLVGERQFGGILGDTLGEGNCESKIVARQWGVHFCRETARRLSGPSGLFSRVLFFLFAPFAGHPSFSPLLGTFSPCSPPRKCSGL